MQSNGNEYTKRRQSNDWKRGSRRRQRVCISGHNCGKRGWWHRRHQQATKAQGAFFNLKIWNTRSIGQNTKIKLFKTLVRPVLLYGCEAWKLTVTEEKKLDRFQFTYLRGILRIWWPQRIRNDAISQVTGVGRSSDEIRGRRWNWIGHVLRKERDDDCMVAMEWQPEGKRKSGTT